MRVTLIAAVAANGVIGKDGAMPWHYPEDLAHFKRVTMGHPVVLGRITFESIVDRLGGPLPGRTNVVLTRNPDRVDTSDPAVVVATTVEEALDCARRAHDETSTDDSNAQPRHSGEDKREPLEVFVAGGASVYEQFLPVADRMVLTEIHDSYDGDTLFPEWDENEWRELERESHDDLSFVTYSR